MRNLSFSKQKWDKRYFIAFLVALVCSLICGLVIASQVVASTYLRRLATDYVSNVFNFNNAALVCAHFFGDLLFFYLFFVIGFFAKIKYINLVIVFFRGVFFGIYIVLIVSANSFVGFIVVLLVFVPTTLISLAVCYLISEYCLCFENKLVFALPAVLALIDMIIMLLLVNIVFRVVIIIV